MWAIIWPLEPARLCWGARDGCSSPLGSAGALEMSARARSALFGRSKMPLELARTRSALPGRSKWLEIRVPFGLWDLGGWGSEVGGCSTGKSFRFVRVCVRAVWLPSGIGSQIMWAGLFPFPFCPRLFLCGNGWARRAFPFPFWSQEFSLFSSPTPQTSYPTLVGLIGSLKTFSLGVRTSSTSF